MEEFAWKRTEVGTEPNPHGGNPLLPCRTVIPNRAAVNYDLDI